MTTNARCRIRWQIFALATVGLLPANFIVLHQWLSASSTDDGRQFPANGQDSFVLPQGMNANSLAGNHNIGQGNDGADAFHHQVDGDDLSWLQHIKVGEFLGSGKYSDTFAAVLDDEYYKRHYPQQFAASKQSPEYIIRIAGNYHDGVSNDGKLVKSERAWNITKRLSPHPSIPATMHYVKQTSNPFNDGRLQFADDSKRKWAKKHMDGRLFKATNVSIDVTERVRPSVKHCEGVHGLLTVPPHMVRCFWRQLFETMSYVHSKGVSIRDTKLWNFMIREPGKIVLFDFNLGHIVDIGSKEYEQIHEEDVQHFGKRIQEYLESQKRDYENVETIPQVDLDDLEDLAKTMMDESKPPPTLMSLLENHEYFLVEADDECLLKW